MVTPGTDCFSLLVGGLFCSVVWWVPSPVKSTPFLQKVHEDLFTIGDLHAKYSYLWYTAQGVNALYPIPFQVGVRRHHVHPVSFCDLFCHYKSGRGNHVYCYYYLSCTLVHIEVNQMMYRENCWNKAHIQVCFIIYSTGLLYNSVA